MKNLLTLVVGAGVLYLAYDYYKTKRLAGYLVDATPLTEISVTPYQYNPEGS